MVIRVIYARDESIHSQPLYVSYHRYRCVGVERVGGVSTLGMVHGSKMPLSLFSRKTSLSRSISASSSSTDSASSCGIFRSVAFNKRRSVAVMVTTDGRAEVDTPSAIEDEPSFTFESSDLLAKDMCLLAFMPELCDVTFLVGRDRKPICAVKSVLAARSP